MKKINIRDERGVLKVDDKGIREYLNNIKVVAWINSDSIEYTILNNNEVDYIFSNKKYYLIEDHLTKKISLLSQAMTDYLKNYDNLESDSCYDLNFEDLNTNYSSHKEIKNSKGEFIFKYQRFDPRQRKRSHLEDKIHQTIIDINNIVVRLLFDAFNQREID